MVEFEFKPTLVGERILVRPLVADDFEELYAAASDPLIWELHPEPLRYQRAVFEERFFKNAVESNSAFVVIDRKTQKIIGSSRYYEWNESLAEVAIGFTFLAKEYWGGTTNRELKRLMLKHAFQWADLVWLHIGKHNVRSRKAAENIGAVFSHEDEKIINGRKTETAFFRILPIVMEQLEKQVP